MHSKDDLMHLGKLMTLHEEVDTYSRPLHPHPACTQSVQDGSTDQRPTGTRTQMDSDKKRAKHVIQACRRIKKTNIVYNHATRMSD